jgi:hypothetical protein
MKNHHYYVHFLLRTTQNQKTFWVAPVEVGESASHGGCFAVPVADGHQLFDHYHIDVATIRKAEPIDIEQHVLEVQTNGNLRLVIKDHFISFRVCDSPGRSQAIPYGGKLSYPDFSLRLVAIETGNEDDIDLLYEKYGMALVGCHPFSHYSGIPKTPTVPMILPSR